MDKLCTLETTLCPLELYFMLIVCYLAHSKYMLFFFLVETHEFQKQVLTLMSNTKS